MNTQFLYAAIITAAVSAAALHSPTVHANPLVVHCQAGGDVVIDDDDASFHVLGDCDEVTILGDNVAIDIDSANSVVIHGDDVRLRIADELLALNLQADDADIDAGDIQYLHVAGSGNTVQADEIDQLEIDGHGNHVAWTGPTPEMHVRGEGNTPPAR